MIEENSLEKSWNDALMQLAAEAAVKRLCTKCGLTVCFIGALTKEQLTKIDPETYLCPECQ